MQVSETIENIVDIYNGNEEIHLIEEEENRNMFADVVRRFGELFDCPTKTFTSLTLILSSWLSSFLVSSSSSSWFMSSSVTVEERLQPRRSIVSLLNTVEGSTTLALDPAPETAPSAGSASTPATSPARDTRSFLLQMSSRCHQRRESWWKQKEEVGTKLKLVLVWLYKFIFS